MPPNLEVALNSPRAHAARRRTCFPHDTRQTRRLGRIVFEPRIDEIAGHADAETQLTLLKVNEPKRSRLESRSAISAG